MPRLTAARAAVSSAFAFMISRRCLCRRFEADAHEPLAAEASPKSGNTSHQ